MSDADLERTKTHLTDTEHVRILAILHYVSGGLQMLGVAFGLVYLAMGGFLAAAQIPANNPQERMALQMFGSVFFIVGLLVVLFNLLTGSALLFAGYCLGRWRAHTYCFVIAIIECLAFPLGTLLGVFTLIVLQRETVKERFAANAAMMD